MLISMYVGGRGASAPRECYWKVDEGSSPIAAFDLPRPCALQTSIITDGFRSLAEGEQVEFYVETGDDGRTKAVQVTGPGGAPPLVGGHLVLLAPCA